MFPLHLELWDAEPSPALTGLLAKVAQRVEERPELMGRSLTAYRLTAELAAGGAYGKPGMLWDATHVCIAFREDGRYVITFRDIESFGLGVSHPIQRVFGGQDVHGASGRADRFE